MREEQPIMPPDQNERVKRYRPLSELVPAHWQIGTIEAADGAQIRYTRTGGAKPAVLLLHGVQATGLTWLRTAQALRAQTHAERMATGLRLLPPGAPIWAEADYVSFVDAQAQFDLAFYRYATNMSYLFEAPDVIGRIACPLLLLTARPMMPGANIEA